MTDASTVCADVQDHLSAYIDSRLSAGDLARVRTHLDGCGACRDERAALERTDALVEAALGDHPFGDAFVEELVTTLPLQRLQARPVPMQRKLRPAGTGLAALAAGLLLAVGIGLTQEREDPTPHVVAKAPSVVAAAGDGLLILADDGSTLSLTAGDPIRAGDHLLAVATPASVRLPDGTRVDLHADTEVELREDDDGGLTVAFRGMEGKIFCDVSKREHPFRVDARDLDVLVLGTEFLVEQRHSSSSVIVVEGKVLTKTPVDRRTLTVGDQAEAYLDAGKGRLSHSRVTPRRHALWVPRLAEEQSQIDAAAAKAAQQAAPVEEPTAPTTPTTPPTDPTMDLPVDTPKLQDD